jgi:hypothetical protein
VDGGPPGQPTIANAGKAERGGTRAKFKKDAEDWNRTSDTSIFSAVLYQLSYLGTGNSLLAEP